MALLSRGSGDDTRAAEPDETVAPTQRTLSTGIVKVNLLPPEIGEARRLRVIQAGAAAGAVLAVAVVGGLWYHQNSALSAAKSAKTRAQVTNAREQAEVARLGNVQDLFNRVDAAEAMVTQATTGEIHWSNYLDDLSIGLPDHVWLTNVTLAATPAAAAPVPTAPTAASAGSAAAGVVAPPTVVGSVSLTGSGYVHKDVANLLERLAKLRGFINVYLSNSTETLVGTTTKIPTVTWTTTSGLDSSALAHPNGGGDR